MLEKNIWSPGSKPTPPLKSSSPDRKHSEKDDGIPAIWTPPNAGTSPIPEKKEFRPVQFESPVLRRKKLAQERIYYMECNIQGAPEIMVPAGDSSCENKSKKKDNIFSSEASKMRLKIYQSSEQVTPPPPPPPWEYQVNAKETPLSVLDDSTSSQNVRSYSSLSQELNAETTATPHLPRVQNPTITLLQKAREGQLPKGSAYLEETETTTPYPSGDRPLISPGEIVYTVKKEYESEPETENEPPKKMADLGPRKFEGIGPTSKEGIPLVLRSEVKENNQTKWYKRMYDSLHRANRNDDYVTIRYKPKRGTRSNYERTSGYLSEPERRVYSDYSGRLESSRRKNEHDFSTSTILKKHVPLKYSTDIYKNQPGRIEDYEPGRSSIAENETKREFEQRSTRLGKPYLSHALKESGYESDSTLVFHRKEDISPLSELEQRLAYKTVQSGGDVPLHGLRKPAPERPKESPRRYVEGEVTIHYRSPVRTEAKESLSETELTRRTAENMRRIYQEERRRKYLQELHDIDSRRHTDNFTPSQKSPIPLNRYDDFIDDSSYKTRLHGQTTPEPCLLARALYNFIGQSSRELNFRRGDIIFIRRQVDKNWYEGEHNAMIGLLPSNYVEILPCDGTPRVLHKEPHEGQARAKFNFIAQSNHELSLAKGDVVLLTRRVDENWYEGRIGNRKGIFPISYVQVISPPESASKRKSVASTPALRVSANERKINTVSHQHVTSVPINVNRTQFHNPPPWIEGTKLHVTQLSETLHIDTNSEPVPYQALYNYKPQNEDELELKEGDTVYVMEKCDDGWYVGSSQRTGYFGTFPGNYVDRLWDM